MSNKGEVEHYFPELVGVAANNPEFITRVKNYLNNIFFDVCDTEKLLIYLSVIVIREII